LALAQRDEEFRTELERLIGDARQAGIKVYRAAQARRHTPHKGTKSANPSVVGRFRRFRVLRFCGSRVDEAAAYRQIGRASQAIAIFEALLADQERILGVEHRDTLVTRNDLAAVYQDVGRVAEAIAIFEPAARRP
jgi:tetratricopeptide (TPR) repeat protein